MGENVGQRATAHDVAASDRPATAASAPSARSRGDGRSRSAARSAAAVVAAFLVLLAADVAASSTVLVALLGGSLTALWGVGVVGVVTCVVLIAVTRAVTGRMSVVGPIVVTLGVGAVGAWGFVTGHLTVVLAEPATPAAHLLICLAGALVLGLFTGPSAFRVAGGAAAVGLLAWVVVISPPIPFDARPPASGDRAQREANFEEFLRTGIPPLVTDREGWQVTNVESAGATATSQLLSPDGGALIVVVDRTPRAMKWDVDAYTCWQLLDRYSSPDTSTTFEGWADRCAKTAAGWESLDRSAVAWEQRGEVVMVIASVPLHTAAQLGERAATPDEISEVRRYLRPLDDAEMREAFADQHLGPAEYR